MSRSDRGGEQGEGKGVVRPYTLRWGELVHIRDLNIGGGVRYSNGMCTILAAKETSPPVLCQMADMDIHNQTQSSIFNETKL